MGNDQKQTGISRIVQKVGVVSTAAAALLASSTANAHESDVLKSLLDRAVVVSASATPDERKKVLLAPLVLKRSLASPDLMLARGHRSHSSHSSHRSHSSHVSSSGGGGRSGGNYSPNLDRSEEADLDSGSTARPNKRQPLKTPAKVPAPAPSAPPPSKLDKSGPDPLENVDLDNPQERFQVLSVVTVKGANKAYIKDIVVGRAAFFELGEEVGEFKLTALSVVEKTIELTNKKNEKFILKKFVPGKSAPAKDSPLKDGQDKALPSKK